MNKRTRRATLLINPAARGSLNFDGVRALKHLRANQVTPRLAISRDADHGMEIARRAVADEDDLLFVVGGDGSARGIAGVLAGSQTALATLRGGTANVWAHEMGIPAGLRGIDAHLSGQVVAIDLCYCNEEPFLLMAGIGWDATIASRVRPATKQRLGAGAYVLEGLRELPRLRPLTVTLSVDGEAREERVAMVLLSNTRLYGSVARLSRDADATDGMLDVLIVAPAGPLATVNSALRLAVPGLADGEGVTRLRAREVSIATAGLAIQLDGDVSGTTPATFSVRPRVLNVSVPAGPLPEVLGG
jgi:YegS/Rv2252/BmrU family lipid kinase